MCSCRLEKRLRRNDSEQRTGIHFQHGKNGGFFINAPLIELSHLKVNNAIGANLVNIKLHCGLEQTWMVLKKLPLMKIEKSANPCCFKNVKSKTGEFEINKKTWMKCDLFKKWLLNNDKKFGKQNLQIILFC